MPKYFLKNVKPFGDETGTYLILEESNEMIDTDNCSIAAVNDKHASATGVTKLFFIYDNLLLQSKDVNIDFDWGDIKSCIKINTSAFVMTRAASHQAIGYVDASEVENYRSLSPIFENYEELSRGVDKLVGSDDLGESWDFV